MIYKQNCSTLYIQDNKTIDLWWVCRPRLSVSDFLITISLTEYGDIIVMNYSFISSLSECSLLNFNNVTINKPFTHIFYEHIK